MDGPANARTAWAAHALLAFALAEAATVVVCGLASSLTWTEIDDLLVPSNAIIGLSMAIAGWPIARHRPGNPIGWLLMAGGCLYASTAAGITALAWASDQGWAANPFWRVVATVTNGGWTWALSLFIPLTLMLFPDGRLAGPRWRYVAAVPIVNGVLWCALGVMWSPGLTADPAVGVPGYLRVDNKSLLGALSGVFALLILFTYLAAVASVLLRYRRASEGLRQQLLWPVLAVLVVLTSFVLDPVLPDSTLILLLIALIPISITVGIVRHQLFDIRLVFSRSLVYLLLTGGVVGAYVLLVAGLDHVLRAQVSVGTSLLATFAIALAFNPARVRLQRAIDRAVYGARQDPVRAMAEVGARLGEVGTVRGAGLDGVLEALGQVLKLPSASVVLDGRQIASYGDPPEALHAVPLLHGDERLGELVVGLRAGESRLDPVDQRVLDLLAAPIAVAVHADTLADEVRRSRERVIQSREEERRRLRRDLHDGLGPVLTGVVLNSDAALRLVESDPKRSAELLAALRDQTTAALQDIRRIVYDLRPPALDSLGLVGALEEYAMVLSRRADGEPLRVAIDAPHDAPRLPAAVEVAAYRIVTEALTNVTRHSSASNAVVTVALESDTLRVAVHDDGVNVGGGWEPGVGLTSIRERAAELGGSCSISHDRTGGRVDVELPVSARAEADQSGFAAERSESTW
jgi:two-component system NarL family sensor kinase